MRFLLLSLPSVWGTYRCLMASFCLGLACEDDDDAEEEGCF